MTSSLEITNPFLDNVSGLSRHSHKQVRATCQFKVSEKCSNIVTQEYRLIYANMERNDGRYICLYCSRALKFSGRSNPNCRYKTLDDNFFENIDTEAKAYLLGWIASDGHVGEDHKITIKIHEKDKEILSTLRDIICPELPIFYSQDRFVGFNFCSKNITDSICKALSIRPGKKAQVVQMPLGLGDELTWAFIRGVFDGDGSVRKFKNNRFTRECKIASTSDKMKEQISKFCRVKNYIDDGGIVFTGVNSVDFLGRIYDNADPRLRLRRKYDLYLEYLGFAPGLPGLYGNIPCCKYIKTDINAIAPRKNNVSDEGYDLWLIGIDKKISDDTIRYETGIKIQPQDGWHVEILPRSSLSNSGYILSNSIGMIDESFRGTLKITLTKINKAAKDIEFPFKAVQMVLRRSIHFICDEVDELDDTARAEGGFGSTDIVMNNT